MRRRWIVPIVCGAVLAPLARAQYSSPADLLVVESPQALTWSQDSANVVLLDQPVTIRLDRNLFSADSAVVWVTSLPHTVGELQRVEIALVGNARIEQPNGIVRTGGRLYVDARVRGKVSLLTQKRIGGQAADTDLYKAALAVRPVLLGTADSTGRWIVAQPEPPGFPSTQPADRFRPLQPVTLSADNFRTAVTPGGKITAILSGKVTMVQKQSGGGLIELLADRAVVFTPFESLGDIAMTEQIRKVEEAVTGVYLEGDVRIVRTPADTRRDSEQRLQANRAFYDFTTDRAVLTDVILHTVDPGAGIPLIVRADLVRQLSEHEYSAENAEITSSSFNTPSYSIGASSTYIRQSDISDPVRGTRTSFVAHDPTFRLWDTPVFYLPAVAGYVTEKNALRNIQFVGSSDFGIGARTEWGLFETLGRIPPKGTDISYHLDYLSKRGPAVGLDGKYVGGWFDNNTLSPNSFSGDFNSYLVLDNGEDHLGRKRLDVTPDNDVRGRFYWQHQQFFDDWQIQLAGGYISDPTFLEQWFTNDFRNSSPLDTSVYAKHQEDSEAYTFLVSGQPNDFVTVANQYQEQASIQRLPEAGYYRVGDSLAGDSLTFFSSNTLSALEFRDSDHSLADLGFRPTDVGRQSPGLPSYGQTGTPEDPTYRGDFRQEIDWPISIGRFKAVPYVVGRYTNWSQAVEGGGADRLYAGGGLKLTTAFWKNSDQASSDLLDIHRIRHVIEPTINIYGAGSSEDASSLLMYDEPVDRINDIGAVQFGTNHRWQTKRGGPGNWRSVDFFTLNIESTHYFNEPSDREIQPTDFRGLFFVSNPESSIPRNSLNAQYEWRVSDVMSIPGDVQYNLDENTLATASIGLSVRQDQRVDYYLGLRHIGVDIQEVINGNTFTFDNQDLLLLASNYQLTTNYRLGLAIGYDMAQSRTDRALLSLTRRFDRFFVEIAFRLDRLQDESAVF